MLVKPEVVFLGRGRELANIRRFLLEMVPLVGLKRDLAVGFEATFSLLQLFKVGMLVGFALGVSLP